MNFKCFFFLFTLIASLLFSCNPIDTAKERANPQTDQTTAGDATLNKINFQDFGYNTEKVFIYKVTSDSRVDTLGLFCSPVMNDDSQYNSYWIFLKRDDQHQWVTDSKVGYSGYQGIGLSDSFLFIHPPRFSFLKYTQFLPYPNFEKGENEWVWDFKIGKRNWEIPGSYPIDSTVVLHITYSVDSNYNSRLPGSYKIESVSTSTFGTASATFVLEENIGITSMHFSDQQQHKLTFELLEKNTDHTALWKSKAIFKSTSTGVNF